MSDKKLAPAEQALIDVLEKIAAGILCPPVTVPPAGYIPTLGDPLISALDVLGGIDSNLNVIVGSLERIAGVMERGEREEVAMAGATVTTLTMTPEPPTRHDAIHGHEISETEYKIDKLTEAVNRLADAFAK